MSTTVSEGSPRASSAEPGAAPQREPKGYTLKYGLASYGLFLAILTPVLGGLAVKLQHLNPGDLDAATSQLALVTGVGALFALVTQPLAGRLSDRTRGAFGMRRPWILVGVIGAGLSLIGIGLAGSTSLVLILWCCAQLFSNVAQAAETATVPDQVPVHRRGVVSGIVGACSPLAILTGAVGLAQLPTDALRFAVPAVIGILFGLWFAVTLKDRVADQAPSERLSVKEFFGSFVFNPRKHPDFGWAWLSKFLVMFGYASVGTYLVLFLAAKFGMTDTADQTRFNMYANFVSVFFMVLLSVLGGRMSDRVGKRRVFVAVGGALVAVGVLLLAVSPSLGHGGGLALVLVGEGFLGAGAGLFLSVDAALCTQVLPNEEDTAKDLGVLNIANALPQSIAPMLAGPIIVAVGAAGYSVWFGIGAIIAALGGLSVLKIRSVR